MTTKTEATREARRQLSYGYFVESGTAAYVTCPRCRRRVTAGHAPWEKPRAALLSALAEHLLEDHP